MLKPTLSKQTDRQTPFQVRAQRPPTSLHVGLAVLVWTLRFSVCSHEVVTKTRCWQGKSPPDRRCALAPAGNLGPGAHPQSQMLHVPLLVLAS